jgi:exonuclease III
MANVKIMQWNINGLFAKFGEFKNHLNQYPYDFLCLQETRVKTTKDIRIYGYTIERKDRPNNSAHSGGGLVIAIKNGISYTNIDIKDDHDTMAIKFYNKNTPYILINTYIPPHTTGPIICSRLQKIEASLTSPNYIIVGDFNSKHPLWGSSNIDAKGRELQRFIDRNNTVILNDGRGTHLLSLTLTCAPWCKEMRWQKLKK